ncbi:MAG TPA: hypothetical protein VHD38_00700, partial [Candidatus Paceibacterota bacterium]|nr:hypothetical protein [Candidatus Paceibacterota bacterium]
MHKNWQAINKEKDAALRFLVSATTDARILAGLKKGFPEFFSEEEAPLTVALSTIKEWREEGNEDPPLPETVLEYFGIPHFKFGSGPNVAFPEEWRSVLNRKNISINNPR